MFGERTDPENNTNHISQSPEAPRLTVKNTLEKWRIALGNHYAWLQTRWWRMHERQINSWGFEKCGE